MPISKHDIMRSHQIQVIMQYIIISYLNDVIYVRI